MIGQKMRYSYEREFRLAKTKKAWWHSRKLANIERNREANEAIRRRIHGKHDGMGAREGTAPGA